MTRHGNKMQLEQPELAEAGPDSIWGLGSPQNRRMVILAKRMAERRGIQWPKA